MTSALMHTYFEEAPLTVLEHQGEPVWIARQVGNALGYADFGKRFATRITGEWADEFIEGHDYDIAPLGSVERINLDSSESTGSVLLEEASDDGVLSFSSPRGTLVLYESGLHLALVKTTKPLGVKIRRWLVEEVLPQIARHGSYRPAEPQPELSLSDRRLRAREIRKTAAELDKAGVLTPELRVKYALMAGEVAVGHRLPTATVSKDPVQELAARFVEVDHWELGTAGRDLYDAYTQICEARGLPPLGRYTFYARLRDLGWETCSDTSKRVWMVRLRGAA